MANLAFCYSLFPVLHGRTITPMGVYIGEVRLVCLQSECKQTLFDSAALWGHFGNILPRVCRGPNLSRINSYRDRSNIFWKLNHWSAQTSPTTRMLTSTGRFTAHLKGNYRVWNYIRFLFNQSREIIVV